MPRDLTQEETHGLETLVDACGIDSVLMSLSEVCGSKAAHVAEHWQDAKLAKAWLTLEGAIGVIVPKAKGL